MAAPALVRARSRALLVQVGLSQQTAITARKNNPPRKKVFGSGAVGSAIITDCAASGTTVSAASGSRGEASASDGRASAKLGIRRNLTAGEIAGQVAAVLNRQGVVLGSSRGNPTPARINLVFMGMGEPFLNYSSFIAAVHLLNNHMQIPDARMTVSTSGILPGILQASLFAAWVVYYARKKGFPREKRMARRDLIAVSLRALPALAVPAIVMIGIYGGFVTVTAYKTDANCADADARALDDYGLASLSSGSPEIQQALAHLDAITRRLRAECPWDREQNERTIGVLSASYCLF